MHGFPHDVPDDDLGPEFGNTGERRDHYADGHYAGCPNCHFPVDITVQVWLHEDFLLNMMGDLLDTADPLDVIEAINETRGLRATELALRAIDDLEYPGFAEASERSTGKPSRLAQQLERKRAAKPRRRRGSR